MNKLATLRNSRGGDVPNLVICASDLIGFGAEGITVHPRPDGRHIRTEDVYDLAKLLRIVNRKIANPKRKIEFNIEGFPSPTYMALVEETRPDQATLVPDPPEAITSNAGWRVMAHEGFLHRILERLHDSGVRTSLFVDAFKFDKDELAALHRLKPDRVELYTERYALDYGSAAQEKTTKRYADVTRQIADLGIEINAGHDLNSQNIGYLLKKVPEIVEVSIGHALIVEALYSGFRQTIQRYKQQMAKAR